MPKKQVTLSIMRKQKKQARRNKSIDSIELTIDGAQVVIEAHVLNSMIDAHKEFDYEYFGGKRPNIDDIHNELELIQFSGESWLDFLWVNGLT